VKTDMELRELAIGPADHAWHEAYFRYVHRVFPEIDFRGWRDLGGWGPEYCALSLAEGDEIVANVSLCRMDLIFDGVPRGGWQLGAVGVVPERRGTGLQRRLMRTVFARVPECDVLILFANDTVLDFYPRFGFQPVREDIFAMRCDVVPAGPPLRRLSLDEPADVAMLLRIAETSEPVTYRAGARAYGRIVLWYGANFHGRDLYHVPEEDAVIVAAEDDAAMLRVHDILAPRHIAIERYLPRLVSSWAGTIELGFAPDRYFTDARPCRVHTESQMFVRGAHLTPRDPVKFPTLAQT
jgi:GNAT superfamily N-acetyltransferase